MLKEFMNFLLRLEKIRRESNLRNRIQMNNFFQITFKLLSFVDEVFVEKVQFELKS